MASVQLASPLTSGDLPDHPDSDASILWGRPNADNDHMTCSDMTEEIPNGGYGVMPPQVPVGGCDDFQEVPKDRPSMKITATKKKKKKKGETEDKAAKSSESMSAKLKQVLAAN